MKNVVLIGMPGAGKSTIGVLLAKSMLYSFIDTDLLIQNSYGKSLCDIIDENGTDEFLKIENDVICSGEFERSVIATGGSAVYGTEAMKKLNERELGIIRRRYYRGRTQMEIADEIGISQAQVSRLEKAAIDKLRKYMN